MESMIDAGHEWLEPLLQFRDWLASTQDPSVKPQQREYKGRNGRVRMSERGLLWRTYTLDFSQEMLRRLLHTQAQIQQEAPDCLLIGEAELHEIRRLWLTERQDWQDALPRIYQEVTGRTLDWARNDISTPGTLELELLEQVADQHDVPIRLAQKLLDAEWQYHGMRRRALIHKTIERIIGEDWRSLEQVLADAGQRTQPGETRAAAE
jgi:DNA sulfur modification protein DndC